MAKNTPPVEDPIPARALREALAHWARTARQRTSPPPTAEDLLALHAGHLEPREAERLRDRLSTDPELADLFLELTRAEPPDGEPIADTEVDAAWRALPHQHTPRPRRWMGWAAAAVLLLTGALAIWFPRSDNQRDVLATDHRLDVPLAILRDTRVTIPNEATGLAFQIEKDTLDASDVEVVKGVDLEALLFDANDTVVHSATPRWGPSGNEVLFVVPADRLTWGRTYRLVVRAPSNPAAVLEWVLTPVVDGPMDPPPSP